MKILERRGGNPIYDIICAFKLLLRPRRNNHPDSLTYLHKLKSKCNNIFSSPSITDAFFYFCMNGAATAWTLQYMLSIHEATAYRALKSLRAAGIVEPAIKVSKIRGSRGGPRPVVWGIIGCSREEVAQAINLHLRILSPKYRIAEEIAQKLLDDYLQREIEEITIREILIHISEMRIPFRTLDIAQFAAQYLHDRGVKVWR